jgi:hypothetical protein
MILKIFLRLQVKRKEVNSLSEGGKPSRKCHVQRMHFNQIIDIKMQYILDCHQYGSYVTQTRTTNLGIIEHCLPVWLSFRRNHITMSVTCNSTTDGSKERHRNTRFSSYYCVNRCRGRGGGGRQITQQQCFCYQNVFTLWEGSHFRAQNVNKLSSNSNKQQCFFANKTHA